MVDQLDVARHARRRSCRRATSCPPTQLVADMEVMARLINANLGFRVLDGGIRRLRQPRRPTEHAPGPDAGTQRGDRPVLPGAVSGVGDTGDDHDVLRVRTYQLEQRRRRHRPRHGGARTSCSAPTSVVAFAANARRSPGFAAGTGCRSTSTSATTTAASSTAGSAAAGSTCSAAEPSRISRSSPAGPAYRHRRAGRRPAPTSARPRLARRPVGSALGHFVPLSPWRIYDTRNGIGGRLGTRSARARRSAVQIAGLAGVPAGGVSAVAVNVTSVNATQSTNVFRSSRAEAPFPSRRA